LAAHGDDGSADGAGVLDDCPLAEAPGVEDVSVRAGQRVDLLLEPEVEVADGAAASRVGDVLRRGRSAFHRDALVVVFEAIAEKAADKGDAGSDREAETTAAEGEQLLRAGEQDVKQEAVPLGGSGAVVEQALERVEETAKGEQQPGVGCRLGALLHLFEESQ
jgi:hypothetical protein